MGPVAATLLATFALAAEDDWFKLARLPVPAATDVAAYVEGQLGPDHPEPQRLRLAIVRVAVDGREQRTFTSAPASASRLERFEAVQVGCGPEGPAIVASFLDERPDEVRRTVIVVGGPTSAAPVQLLRYGATADERPAVEPPALPGARPGLRLERDGAFTKISLREAPVLLPLVGPGGEARPIVAGRAERRFVCDGAKLRTDVVAFVDRFGPDAAPAGPAGDGDPQTFLRLEPGATLVLPFKDAFLVRIVAGCPGGIAPAAQLQGFTTRALPLSGPPRAPAELYGAVALPLEGLEGVEQRLFLAPEARTGTVRVVVPAGGAPLCLRELWLSTGAGAGG